MENQAVVKSLQNTKVQHLIINTHTFRNVKHTDEIEYLQKLLNSFKQSYSAKENKDEAVVIYEALPCLKNIESYLKSFTEENGFKMITI